MPSPLYTNAAMMTRFLEHGTRCLPVSTTQHVTTSSSWHLLWHRQPNQCTAKILMTTTTGFFPGNALPIVVTHHCQLRNHFLSQTQHRRHLSSLQVPNCVDCSVKNVYKEYICVPQRQARLSSQATSKSRFRNAG